MPIAAPARPGFVRRALLGAATLRVLLGVAVAGLLCAQPMRAAAADVLEEPEPAPRVVVVLAGGGAKGFAHLAVLRRLERNRVPIHRIVGTSMGAVVGGLYASGLSVDEIEGVIGNLDPTRVALDQIDRNELPAAQRSYQSQYPIGLELGINEHGQLGFARGASDGQRFLDLLQRLTANVPSGASFDALRIPFRAVATRYRDGEPKVFDRGDLHLAIRASMAAPGVFAPALVEGETYVDGGLVANLPVEVALAEGADVVVASYLAQPEAVQADPANALTAVSGMIDILIRQNERRSLAALRPQDILVRSHLPGVDFADFGKAAQVVAMGERAVQAQDARFAALAVRVAVSAPPARRPAQGHTAAYDPRKRVVAQVRVQGQRQVPAEEVLRRFADLVGRPFDAGQVGARVDALYAEGLFERVHYSLQPLQEGRHALILIVEEKPYGPHFLRPLLSLYSDRDANHLYSLGLGYRRRFLTASGLEMRAQLRVGTPTEVSAQLIHPVWNGWRLGADLGARHLHEPAYRSPEPVKLAYSVVSTRSIGADIEYEWERHALVRAAIVRRAVSERLDTALLVSIASDGGALQFGEIPAIRYRFNALRLQFDSDLLDSVTFPTEGHAVHVDLEQGVGGARYVRREVNVRWAARSGPHVVNLGLNAGRIDAPGCDLSNCLAARSLNLGGFQAMGAFSAGQLSGDRLAHVQLTYMRRLQEGGLLRQPVYMGWVAEFGDAWDSAAASRPTLRSSLTAFVGIDSRIGEFYIGAARGRQGNDNVFMQLGRRFEIW
ncbi:patatin-like phospholipase family protein [Rhizobacter sp. AJA081-3]|uniref:patatin-like phospholipase family protein n=1 Tax=Rhizobacter sp. AJA081-3 TaxID=2753607 RepID=UPI003530384C